MRVPGSAWGSLRFQACLQDPPPKNPETPLSLFFKEYTLEKIGTLIRFNVYSLINKEYYGVSGKAIQGRDAACGIDFSLAHFVRFV